MTKYRTIVADPPWRYATVAPFYSTGQSIKAPAKNFGVTDQYSTLSNQELAALPVSGWADENAHLYLWVTNSLMFERQGGVAPIDVIESWGFTYKTLLTWDKTGPLGLGSWFRGRTEHVMFCVRGSLPIEGPKREQNIFHSPNGRHSEKPDAFYDLVERVSPGPYLELFARRARFGWDYWGDESLQTVELAS